MIARVGTNNFTPNTAAINWNTAVVKDSGYKTTQNEYLLPSFNDMLNKMINYANKVADGYALVGDLSQYHVDIYKDFVLKIGWVNDDLIRNQFSTVGEIRWHDYISDSRKPAIIYGSLDTVVAAITQ